MGEEEWLADFIKQVGPQALLGERQTMNSIMQGLGSRGLLNASLSVRSRGSQS